MLPLALWGIKKIAGGAINTTASAVDAVTQRIPNAGPLDHPQTLAWRRLESDAKKSGSDSDDAQSALADLRATLTGEANHPEALAWFASLTPAQKRDALVVLSGLV
jgi:hypothetical protein